MVTHWDGLCQPFLKCRMVFWMVYWTNHPWLKNSPAMNSVEKLVTKKMNENRAVDWNVKELADGNLEIRSMSCNSKLRLHHPGFLLLVIHYPANNPKSSAKILGWFFVCKPSFQWRKTMFLVMIWSWLISSRFKLPQWLILGDGPWWISY